MNMQCLLMCINLYICKIYMFWYGYERESSRIRNNRYRNREIHKETRKWSRIKTELTVELVLLFMYHQNTTIITIKKSKSESKAKQRLTNQPLVSLRYDVYCGQLLRFLWLESELLRIAPFSKENIYLSDWI